MKTVAELAELVGGVVEGDGNVVIESIAGLREAQVGELSFLNNAKYANFLRETKASAVLVDNDFSGGAPTILIRVENPDASFEAIAAQFVPPPIPYEPGIHPSAVIAEDVTLGEGVHIGPNVTIHPGAVIGARCELLAGCLISHGVVLGDDCRIMGNVSIREHVCIGNRVTIHNNAVIGSDGFGYSVDETGVRTKVPQVGTVVIGDDVELGAGVCVDRARFGKTRIGNGVKVDNLVQIAHNVVLGDHVVLVAQVGVAGSAIIGARSVIAGQVGVGGHLQIGAGSVVGAQAGVTKDMPPNSYLWGTPAMPLKKFSKNQANLNRLPKLMDRVAALEARLQDLQSDD